MQTRVAVMAIIVEEPEAVEKLTALLMYLSLIHI